MAAPRGRGLRPGGVVRALGRLVLLVCVGFALGLLFGLVTEEPELLASHLRGEGESVDLERQKVNDGSLTAEASPLEEEDWVPLGLGLSGREPELESRRADRLADKPGMVQNLKSNAKRSVTNIGAKEGAEAPQRKSASDSISRRDDYASAATQIRRLETAKREAVSESGLPAVAAKRSQPVASVPAMGVPEVARRAARQAQGWSIQVGAFSDEAAASELAEGLRDRYPVVVLPAAAKDGRWRVRVQPIAGESLAREMADRLKREERLPTWVTRAEVGSGS